ncbi:MAG: hypothetical protein NZ772_09500 [Cyanobacteria bacterium]|nr:hypothetical protein [Cyanobacteriota bacterium]MDW8200262.1 hypothetical protein [Cyanobacteriota bacterium SKYGB_h_bin112]
MAPVRIIQCQFLRAIQVLGIAALIFLAVGLSACSPSSVLPSDVVERALAMHLGQTAELLAQQLRLPSTTLPLVDIQRFRIVKKQALPIENLLGYQVQGLYDAILYWPERRLTQRQQSFTLYLQRQSEGKTWRLAYPIPQADGSFTWNTQQIE